MTSLREEIFEYVDATEIYRGGGTPLSITNHLISIIEKRIDVLKQETEKEKLGYDPDVYYARIDMIDEIKEMLK